MIIRAVVTNMTYMMSSLKRTEDVKLAAVLNKDKSSKLYSIFICITIIYQYKIENGERQDRELKEKVDVSPTAYAGQPVS